MANHPYRTPESQSNSPTIEDRADAIVLWRARRARAIAINAGCNSNECIAAIILNLEKEETRIAGEEQEEARALSRIAGFARMP